MATYTQLLNTLQNGSYISGWGAIAAFDGATIGPMLGDCYASMIHGGGAVRPIATQEEIVYLTDNRQAFATIQNFVVAAPQVSLGAGSLQNPKVLLTYELTHGLYSERSKTPGSPEQVVTFINLVAGRRHTLSVELDLADAIGRIDDEGSAWLTLGAASNPLCSLGSTDVAKRAVGERLFELLSARLIGPTVLALGSLMPERKYLRPTSFMLRPQAGPEGTAGALLVLIAKPGSAPGDIPSQAVFPYLIPEGRDSAGKAYSATLLVARDYPMLREGEAEQLFGQILFPGKEYFKTSSTHQETRDIVLFGGVAPPAQAAARKARRNAPGTTTQLLTLSASAAATPVSLLASSSIPTGWSWELPQPALGILQAESGAAGAVYTPPDRLPEGKSVLLQRAVATNSGTGERYEVCFVLQASYNPVVAFSPALLGGLAFGTSYKVNHDFYLDDYREEWSVVGRGTATPVSGIGGGPGVGSYRSPAAVAGGADIELLVCEIFMDRPSGDPRLIGYGYVIMQLGETVATGQWTTPEPFKLRAKQPGAPLYANGLQQFEIEVEIGTGTNQPDITDAEFATLRLAIAGGADIPAIPHTLEGLKPDVNGVTAQWGYKTEPNGYQLAGNTTSPATQKPVEDATQGAVRKQTFFVHTVAQSPVTLVARITAADGTIYSSSSSSSEQGQETVVTVSRRNPPAWAQEPQRIPRKRVVGESHDRSVPADPNYTSENPHYGWYLRTCDYWMPTQQINLQPVNIKRIQIHSDGPLIKWESPQNNEDGFSYVGYALITGQTTPTLFQFASVLSNPTLYLPKVFSGAPGHAEIKHASSPGAGKLLFSVNRVIDVFYRQREVIKAAAGGQFEFEQSSIFSVWDEYGNYYKLEVSFESDNRDKLQIRAI